MPASALLNSYRPAHAQVRANRGDGKHYLTCIDVFLGQVVVCQIFDLSQRGVPRDVAQSGKFVYDWYAENHLLPTNPAGFSARTLRRQPAQAGKRMHDWYRANPKEGRKTEVQAVPKKQIRVLIVERETTRAILNVVELVDACNQDEGPWECRRTHLGGGLARFSLCCCHVFPLQPKGLLLDVVHVFPLEPKGLVLD